ncbi:hypothetical protein KGM_214215A, partial [Danaus plexippus plexippus]
MFAVSIHFKIYRLFISSPRFKTCTKTSLEELRVDIPLSML